MDDTIVNPLEKWIDQSQSEDAWCIWVDGDPAQQIQVDKKEQDTDCEPSDTGATCDCSNDGKNWEL